MCVKSGIINEAIQTVWAEKDVIPRWKGEGPLVPKREIGRRNLISARYIPI